MRFCNKDGPTAAKKQGEAAVRALAQPLERGFSSVESKLFLKVKPSPLCLAPPAWLTG